MSAISIISSVFFFCSRNLTWFPWLSSRSPGGSDVSGAQVARLFASNQTQDRPALVSTFSSTSVPHSPFVFKHSPTLPLRHMLSTSTFVLFPTNISIGCLRTLHPPACRVSFLVKFLSFSFFREKLLDSWQSHFGHFEREVSLRLWVSFPGRTPGKSRAQIYNGE